MALPISFAKNPSVRIPPTAKKPSIFTDQYPPAAALERRDDVSCYHSGWPASRETLATAIDDFCDEVGVSGLRKNDNQEKTMTVNGVRVILSIHAKGCDAIDQDLKCKSILRRPVDECNTDGENWKQGGTVEAECATWRVDPEYN